MSDNKEQPQQQQQVYVSAPPPVYAQQPQVVGMTPTGQPIYATTQPMQPQQVVMGPGGTQQVVYTSQPMVGQPAPVGTTTVVVQQASVRFGPVPQRVVCQFCSADVVTATRTKVGLLVWLCFGGLIILGCWLGCCLIPFCIDSLKDVEHECPNCKRIVGTYARA